MPASSATLSIEVLSRIGAVPAAQWDAHADPDDPFTRHDFLLALEESGSACPETGWAPSHMLARQGEKLVGSMPLYLKGHSHGEYIFDWGWADAAMRNGIRYYPKLLSAVPFTPATGPRLRVDPTLSPEEQEHVRRGLLAGAVQLAQRLQASSFHLLFCTEAERASAEAVGLIGRQTMQFHWQDRGYGDFEGWLASFRSRRRKETRRERRLPTGVQVHDLRGEQLNPVQARAVRAFYEDTCDKRGGEPYLSPDFFARLGAPLACRVLLAEVEERPVAMSLLFPRGRNLYGRYWGCLPQWESLHFELCYHRPIELCLREGFTRFEAGAQGTHKIQRGLMPSPTWSAHWIRHPGLSAAVAEACVHEARQVQRQMAVLAEHGPFHREEEGGDPVASG